MVSQKEWAARRGAVTCASRASITGLLSTRMWLIGVDNPSERTLFRLAAIVAFCMGEYDADQERIHADMDAIQLSIKSKNERRPAGFPYITDYKPTAEELPDAAKAFAYPDGVFPPPPPPSLHR